MDLHLQFLIDVRWNGAYRRKRRVPRRGVSLAMRPASARAKLSIVAIPYV